MDFETILIIVSLTQVIAPIPRFFTPSKPIGLNIIDQTGEEKNRLFQTLL
jgi:hypothetical protein